MNPTTDQTKTGLSAIQAQERLAQYGPNAVPEERPHPFRLFLRKFWSPVPWMLELTLVLELALGKYTQGIIITSLLILNAVLSFIQESRASGALSLLRQRLAIMVRVLRDGRWQLIVAQDLVSGDVIRVLTYTLNKIIKTFQIALLLSLGLVLTGVFVTTPLLILLLLFANDFVTMSLADDQVTFSRKPDRWRIWSLTVSAMVIAVAWLALSFAVFFVGRDVFHLNVPCLQTLVFVALVFTGQATVYLVRERRHFWDSVPGFWLMLTSITAISVVSFLAAFGILMAPISPMLILGVLGLVVACSVVLDFVKIRVFQYCDLG